MSDFSHSQADPLQRHEGPRVAPVAGLAAQDGVEVVNATKECRNLRKLAELAGGPVDQLKEV